MCRKAGISQQTYDRWRKRYGGLMPSEMKRLRQLKEEHQRLTRLVADLSLNTRRCSRRWCDKRSEACRAPRTGRRGTHEVAGEHSPRVYGAQGRPVDLPLPLPTRVAGGVEEADSGDCRDAGALWVSADPRAAQARGVGGQRQARLAAVLRGEPAAAQQDAHAQGLGEAAQGLRFGLGAARGLGDGLHG